MTLSNAADLGKHIDPFAMLRQTAADCPPQAIVNPTRPDLTLLVEGQEIKPTTDYIGVLPKDYNYPDCLPLDQLAKLPLVPFVVWTPRKLYARWAGDLDQQTNELAQAIIRASKAKQFWRQTTDDLVIAHKDVWQGLNAFTRQAVEAFGQQAKQVATRLYFANRIDLGIVQIPYQVFPDGTFLDYAEGQCPMPEYVSERMGDKALQYIRDNPQAKGLTWRQLFGQDTT